MLDTLGQRIAYARRLLDMTGSALAAHTGLRPATISHLEHGTYPDLRASTLLVLARELHCSPAWLLTGSPGYVHGCGELSSAEARICAAVVREIRSR